MTTRTTTKRMRGKAAEQLRVRGLREDALGASDDEIDRAWAQRKAQKSKDSQKPVKTKSDSNGK